MYWAKYICKEIFVSRFPNQMNVNSYITDHKCLTELCFIKFGGGEVPPTF